MERTVNTAINCAIGFVVGYLVASRFGDGDALKPALVSAAITGAIAWAGYETVDDLDDLEPEDGSSA